MNKMLKELSRLLTLPAASATVRVPDPGHRSHEIHDFENSLYCGNIPKIIRAKCGV
jgi:hypothetical protein